MLNCSVHAASTAASTTGRYSGLQPAITALIATFSTLHSTRSGGTTATISSGARVVPCSMRMTRSSVGATSGRPSLQPRANIASCSSSSSASSTRRAWRRDPAKRTSSSVCRSGSTEREPQPGRHSGSSRPRPPTPVTVSHSAAVPADRASDDATVAYSEQSRDGLDAVVPGVLQRPIVDRRAHPAGTWDRPG